MNSLVPLFVIIPLGCAFLMTILGRFVKNIAKIITPIFMLYLVFLSLHFIFNVKDTSVYKVGGFEASNGIPVAIYMVIDGLTKLLLLVISIIGFLSIFYSTKIIYLFQIILSE